jgi:adenosylhomocysteine nucleosidase
MPKSIAIVAALEREVEPLIRNWTRVQREYLGRKFTFFEHEKTVVVCCGMGLEPARRASEAVIALYDPARLLSVGFAGALTTDLRVGDIFEPSAIIDARDCSRIPVRVSASRNLLLSFGSVAGTAQKAKLAEAFGAKAVDMEAAAVAAAAAAHGIGFAAIKVISDEAEFEMPHMERFIDSHGHFKTVSFAFFIIPRPWLWSRVAALASNSRRAAKLLSDRLQRLEPINKPVDLVEPNAPAQPLTATASHPGGRE